MSELPTKPRRRAGTLTAAILALAVGGGTAAVVTTHDLKAQTALNPPVAKAPGGGLTTSFDDVVEPVGPAVVNIQDRKRGGAPGRLGGPAPQQSPGGDSA